MVKQKESISVKGLKVRERGYAIKNSEKNISSNITYYEHCNDDNVYIYNDHIIPQEKIPKKIFDNDYTSGLMSPHYENTKTTAANSAAKKRTRKARKSKPSE